MDYIDINLYFKKNDNLNCYYINNYSLHKGNIFKALAEIITNNLNKNQKLIFISIKYAKFKTKIAV